MRNRTPDVLEKIYSFNYSKYTGFSRGLENYASLKEYCSVANIFLVFIGHALLFRAIICSLSDHWKELLQFTWPYLCSCLIDFFIIVFCYYHQHFLAYFFFFNLYALMPSISQKYHKHFHIEYFCLLPVHYRRKP